MSDVEFRLQLKAGEVVTDESVAGLVGQHHTYMGEPHECVAARVEGGWIEWTLRPAASALVGGEQPVCSTCDDVGEIRMEAQISAPASGGWITCPDCRDLPVRPVEHDTVSGGQHGNPGVSG
jgi:hypothetical protein